MECASALLDEQDRARGYVLACVTSARSDCVIEG
jgi:ferredoxin